MIELSRRYPFTRRNWPWLVGGFAGLLVVALLLDAVVARNAATWPPPLPGFFAVVTELGEAGWILYPSIKLTLLCAGLAVIIRDRLEQQMLIEQVKVWSFVFFGVGVPSLVASLLKRLIGRARPELLDSIGSLNFRSFANAWNYESFPSGHATTAFALAMVVGFLFPRWLVPALTVALLVAISRIAVGAHYFSDTIGGAACGVLLAYAVRHAFAWRGWLFELRPDGTVARKGLRATGAAFSG